jgi:hypothetical protein
VGSVSLDALVQPPMTFNKIMVSFLVIVTLAWIIMHYGGRIQLREKYFHRCPMEWRGPFGAIQNYEYVCRETGESNGSVYYSSLTDSWRYSANTVLYKSGNRLTLEQAKKVVEDALR